MDAIGPWSCREADMKNKRVSWGCIGLATLGGLAILLVLISSRSNWGEFSFWFASNFSLAELAAPHGSIAKVEIHGVQFLRDGSIRPNSKAVLDSAVEFLKSKPNTKVYVDVHCDRTGGQRLNQRLSDEHAAAIASYFEKQGVPANDIVARGFEASSFVVNNTTASTTVVTPQ